VAELVDATDLKSVELILHEGSIPSLGTNILVVQKLKMKKFVLLSLSLGLLLFIFTIQQAGIDSVLKTVYFFPALAILFVFLIIFSAVGIVSSWRWKIIIESQNSHSVSFAKIFSARLAAFAISYVTPAVLVGGDPVRAYMIKEESDYSMEKSLASVIIDEAIYFFTLFLFIIIGFLFLADHFSLPRSVFYSFSMFVAVGVIILYFFYSRLIFRGANTEGFFIFVVKALRLDNLKYIGNRMEKIKKIERIISSFFKNKRGVFVKAFLLSILEVLMYLLMIFIIVFYLGNVISLDQSLSIFSILTFTSFVPIPGSFGSLEMAVTFVFDLMELGKNNGFAFSLIFRLVNIALVAVGFFALMHFELKMLSRDFSLEAPKSIQQLHSFLIKMVYRK
jgi:glycosyltransferase 2 family protein